MPLKLFFVQSSVADEMNWSVSEWNMEENLRYVFFNYKDRVCEHNLELKEGQNLFRLLKDEVLAELNGKKVDEKEPEIILSGEDLCFLSLPSEWKNLKYSAALNLAISKPSYKKRVVVIKTQNPCKCIQQHINFNHNNSFFIFQCICLMIALLICINIFFGAMTVSMVDAALFFQEVEAAIVLGPMGECPITLSDGQLYRSSLACPHFYSIGYLQRNVSRLMNGNFSCVGCMDEDTHPDVNKKKGFITVSLLKGYVNSRVITEEDAVRVIFKMMSTFSKEVLLEVDVQYRNGYKRCPGPRCDAYVIKPHKHGCHHMTCNVCSIQFCYRCLNYHGDGSTYFPHFNGCPTKGCEGNNFCTVNLFDCCCHPCEICKPGQSCDDCDGVCGSCKVDGDDVNAYLDDI